MASQSWFKRFERWRTGVAPRGDMSSLSIADPRLVEILTVGAGANYSGVAVSENSVMALSSVYRAVRVISSTIAGLPLRTLWDKPDGSRARASSVFDNPGTDDGLPPFNWKETVFLHMLLHGNNFLLHLYDGFGVLRGLEPIHPLCVSVEWTPERDVARRGRKLFRVSMPNGVQATFDRYSMTQIMDLSLDGLRGLSPIAIARNTFGMAIAGDRSAAKLFNNGPLQAGMLIPQEDLEDGDEDKIKANIDRQVGGWENANSIAVINRKMQFVPWTMSYEDAQFLQSRQFQIEEISRWYGVPPHLLMQTEKQTSWGTGVTEQNRGLQRYTLSGWTSRFEQTASRLLPTSRFVEFDYAGLLQPTPEIELDMLLKQWDADILTYNEFRRLRNMPTVEGGDVTKTGWQAQAGQPVVPSGEKPSALIGAGR